MSGSRHEIWSNLEQTIQHAAGSYIQGRFESKPRVTPSTKECHTCSVADLCGLRRRIEVVEEEEETG